MTMAAIDTCVGSKRRLPIWMLRETASDQVMKNDDLKNKAAEETSNPSTCPKMKPILKSLENYVLLNEKVSSDIDLGLLVQKKKSERCKREGTIASQQAASKKRKLTNYGPESSEDEKTNVIGEEMHLGTIVRFETRTRTGKKGSCSEESTLITNTSESGAQTKKERTLRKGTRFKKQKRKTYENDSGEVIEASSPSEGSEEELTVDDLMSIAEEYVKANECQGISITEPKQKTQFLKSTTTIISDNVSGDSIQATKRVEEIAKHTTGLCSVLAQEKESSTSGFTRTGDPAQDMLDLLLGPLLKKTQTQKTVDILTKDQTVARNSSSDVTSKVAERGVSLTKKKSSLKDKVAMFLD